MPGTNQRMLYGFDSFASVYSYTGWDPEERGVVTWQRVIWLVIGSSEV